MSRSIKVTNQHGVSFMVKVVKNGEHVFSKSNRRVINKGRTLVEFYDTNKSDPDANVQFVSSYYVSTLISSGSKNGLCLDTGSSTWVLSETELEEVLNFIRQFNVLEIKSVGTDSCGRLVYKSKAGNLYKDARSANFPDSFFTADSFESEPDSPVLKSKFEIVYSF
jgi:hypothetical protein